MDEGSEDVQWAGPRVRISRKEGAGALHQGRENFLEWIHTRMKGVERPTGQPGREN